MLEEIFIRGFREKTQSKQVVNHSSTRGEYSTEEGEITKHVLMLSKHGGQPHGRQREATGKEGGEVMSLWILTQFREPSRLHRTS